MVRKQKNKYQKQPKIIPSRFLMAIISKSYGVNQFFYYTYSVMNETRDLFIQDAEIFHRWFFFNKLGMSKLFKGRHMHQTVNNSNSRKTEWTVWLGQGAFWDLRLLNVNTDSLSTQRSLKHNKHATALISTVIVNQEISQKMKNEKKKSSLRRCWHFKNCTYFLSLKKKNNTG